jgi:hypothetical protein
MNYTELNNELQGRCKQSRKLANNTYAKRYDDCLAIRLHATDIITFYPDGRVIYNTNGWETVTTKQRLNEYGHRGIHVYQRRGNWYINDGIIYRDGIDVSKLMTQSLHLVIPYHTITRCSLV